MSIRKYWTQIIIFLLIPLAIIGMFSGSGWPVIAPLRGTVVEPVLYRLHGNQIIFSLSVGWLVSLYTWFLVVVVPERRRRRVLRNRLRKYYEHFRRDVTRDLLSVGGDQRIRQPAIRV